MGEMKWLEEKEENSGTMDTKAKIENN